MRAQYGHSVWKEKEDATMQWQQTLAPGDAWSGFNPQFAHVGLVAPDGCHSGCWSFGFAS